MSDKTLSFTQRSLAEALANVRCLSDLGPELIAEQVFADLAHQPAPAMPGEDELQQRLQRHDEMREQAKEHAFRMGRPAIYELTTIRDIFEKVPAARIADCCREMGQSLTQARYQIQLMEAAAVALGEVIDMAEAFKVAELVIWIDDGKGEIETRMVDGDGAQLMSVVARPDVEGEA